MPEPLVDGRAAGERVGVVQDQHSRAAERKVGTAGNHVVNCGGVGHGERGIARDVERDGVVSVPPNVRLPLPLLENVTLPFKENELASVCGEPLSCSVPPLSVAVPEPEGVTAGPAAAETAWLRSDRAAGQRRAAAVGVRAVKDQRAVGNRAARRGRRRGRR